uniref:Uncharacterized protein n=1 Tax=Tetradesmus obliquus TaxID=3088 RepID=A0A383V6R5_TETOB|eukprot:jgi/Sobl393_1/3101/SZX61295.1
MVQQPLDEGLWGQFLLPKLLANKAAAAFASSCRKLCQVCKTQQQHLKLQGHHFNMPRDELSRLLTRYPAVTSICCPTNSDYAPLCMGMHVLANRLPCLCSLEVQAVEDYAAAADHMAIIVNTARLQLPGLSNLILDMEGVDDEPWAGRDIAWRALMPNLRKLVVKFRGPDDEESWIYLSDLSALQPLGGRLQHLEVCCGALHSDALQNFTFLSGLTGLTALHLPLCSWAGMPAISALTHLCSLTLDAAELPEGLSRLTRLELAATQDAALAGLSAAPHLRALMLHYHGLRAYSPPPASLEGCSAAGLISLTALTALSQLHLDQVEGKGLNEEEWRQLLSALRHWFAGGERPAAWKCRGQVCCGCTRRGFKQRCWMGITHLLRFRTAVRVEAFKGSEAGRPSAAAVQCIAPSNDLHMTEQAIITFGQAFMTHELHRKVNSKLGREQELFAGGLNAAQTGHAARVQSG